MTAETLLADLRLHGATIEAVGANLEVEAPADLLTDVVVQALREHKSEIMGILKGDDEPPRPADRPGYVCELAYDGARWTWRYRRPGAADSALQTYREHERTGHAPASWNWPARRDPVTGETDVQRSERYRREAGGLPPGASKVNGHE